MAPISGGRGEFARSTLGRLNPRIAFQSEEAKSDFGNMVVNTGVSVEILNGSVPTSVTKGRAGELLSTSDQDLRDGFIMGKGIEFSVVRPVYQPSGLFCWKGAKSVFPPLLRSLLSMTVVRGNRLNVRLLRWRRFLRGCKERGCKEP